jgi:hypothetical protein
MIGLGVVCVADGFIGWVGVDDWATITVGIVSAITNDITRLECFILTSSYAALFGSAMGPARPLPAIYDAISCRGGCFLERFDRLWLPKTEQAHNVDIFKLMMFES